MDIKAFREKLKAQKAEIESIKSAKRLASTQGSGAQTKTLAQLEHDAGRKWGVKTLAQLITVNTADKSFRHIPLEQKEAVKSLKEAVDVTVMCAKYFGQKVEKTKAYQELIEPVLKAFGIDSGDAGFNWIPTTVSQSYIDEYNLDRKVSALFQEIKMPSNPYDYPVLTNGAVATILGEVAEKSTKDTFTAGKITFSAKKLSNQYALPEELQEDSAVDVMKVIRQELIEGQEKALEIAILEGDITSTHQHTGSYAGGTPAADSPERAWPGLRLRALAAGSDAKVNAAATLNESHLRSARAKMGKFGVNPKELAWICGPKGLNEFMDLDDVRTLEQYGPQAPVLTGEMGSYEGIPIICSEWLREDTDTTGVNGASGNTKLTMLLVNRKRWFVGLRRAVQVKVEQFRTAFDVWDMVSFCRRAFQGTLLAAGSNYSTESTVSLIYNITAP